MSNISFNINDRELEDLKSAIEKKTGKSTDELYEEREKRVRDTIELRIPDRIPFAAHVNFQEYTGLPNSTAYYDPVGWKKATRQITLDLEPDMCNAGLPISGDALTILDVKNRLWPGGPVPPDYEMQFLEVEFMKEDEYDMFLSDPSGFMIRRFLPRMYGALHPLEKLPPLDSMYMGFESLTPLFSSSEFIEMAGRIAEAGRQTTAFNEALGHSYEELAFLGFPAFAPVITGGVGGAPFDTLSSFLRGMKGSMVDMYRRPDKLIQACEAILERRIAAAEPARAIREGTLCRVGIPLWRGDKSFMSEKQFDRFYWPGLKKALQANIDLGYIPIPFFEAEFGNRLERLLELPKGKIVASVEHMDARRAREILGGHTAILTRAPLSSKLWSLHELERYYKELIDTCGKGGGLILDIHLPDKAKRDDGRAMIQSIIEYGRY